MGNGRMKYVWLAIVAALVAMLAIPAIQRFDLKHSVMAQTEVDPEVITEVVIADLTQARPGAAEPEVRRIETAGDYALATWIWGEAGGQTLVKLEADAWRVIESGGGAMDQTTLQELGVSAAEADQLLQSEEGDEQR